jgi:hypothetical protein
MANYKQDAMTFKVAICVQDNTLIVGVNGGHVTGTPGDIIEWRATEGVQQFTLQFFRLATEPPGDAKYERVKVAELPHWPFSDPPPPPHGIVGPTEFFRGTLAGNVTSPTAFKYTVTAGNLQVDPIVIIDR